MTEYSILLIPSNMQEPITVSDTVTTGRKPIYVALANRENPDEFEMEFYQGLDTNEKNERASMIVEAMASRGNSETITLTGYILMRCDKVLADRLVENDKGFITDSMIIRGFRDWMREYAIRNELDICKVFDAVACYAGRVLADAQDRATADVQQGLSEMLGLQPEQVGVFVL